MTRGSEPGDAPVQVRPPLDAVEMRERLGNDEELIAEVVCLFREDCIARMNAIAAALEVGDGAQVRSVAHALKGGASTLAAHDVATAAHALELFGQVDDVAAAKVHFPTLVHEVDRLLLALQEWPPRST